MKYEKINYKLVDTAGQITAVILDIVKKDQQLLISGNLMESRPKIEQVVFLGKNRIQTMGNELCINGSLAGAYLSKESVLEISGLDKRVKFIKQNDYISIRLPSNILQNTEKRIIQLQGIVYFISNNNKLANRTYLKNLSDEYSSPAAGLIFYKDSSIRPLIYVKNTDTLVWENACGSGSLAYSIFSGIEKIRQPSNEIIEIKKFKKYFTIKVPVKIVR